MLNHLFENRNTTVTNLLKLGDCLGRSLRENIELFSIDSEEKKVAYGHANHDDPVNISV